MILIKDNNNQTLGSLRITKVSVEKDGKLKIDTDGKYRQLRFSEAETGVIAAKLVKFAMDEKEKAK